MEDRDMHPGEQFEEAMLIVEEIKEILNDFVNSRKSGIPALLNQLKNLGFEPPTVELKKMESEY